MSCIHFMGLLQHLLQNPWHPSSHYFRHTFFFFIAVEAFIFPQATYSVPKTKNFKVMVSSGPLHWYLNSSFLFMQDMGHSLDWYYYSGRDPSSLSSIYYLPFSYPFLSLQGNHSPSFPVSLHALWFQTTDQEIQLWCSKWSCFCQTAACPVKCSTATYIL